MLLETSGWDDDDHDCDDDHDDGDDNDDDDDDYDDDDDDYNLGFPFHGLCKPFAAQKWQARVIIMMILIIIMVDVMICLFFMIYDHNNLDDCYD